MKRRRSKGIVIICVLVLCVGLGITWRSLPKVQMTFPVLDPNDIRLTTSAAANEPLSYIQWIRSEEYMKFGQAENVETDVLAVDYSAASSEANIRHRQDEAKRANVVDWNNAKGWLEWKVVVPKDGLYDLIVDYSPLKGSFSGIIRGIQIDGRYPFIEAERIGLPRYWKDSKFPYDRNSIGNEIRPVPEEIKAWTSTKVSDYSISSEPLLWALTKGTHTIRMVGVSEPISLHKLTLASPDKIPSYTEYVSQHPIESGSKNWFEVFEAEQYKQKSTISIRTLSVAEPFASPDPKGKLLYNAIGGDYWKSPGESLEWAISVPETGYYSIDMKYFQGYNGKANAYRTIMVDGKVPFQEMLHYRFASNNALKIEPLSDRDGNPFLFYLTEGTHRISMTVDNSLIRPVIIALNELNVQLTTIEREIRVISGNYGYGSDQNLDTARVWEITKYDPEMETKLRSLHEDIRQVRDYLTGLNQAVTNPATALSAAMSRIEKLLEDVNNIPNEIKAFSEIKSSINNWIKPIESQALQLDYMVVRTPQTDSGLKVPNKWDKVKYTTANFGRTFFQKYDTNEMNEDDALTIWVQRGQDYVDLLQTIIEQDFTPKTGIKVNVNLIPNRYVLLMGNAAGDQPDLALGVGMETPVDFAMRGAVEDLSHYPGFSKVMERFNPGVMRSYRYDDKIYGLPETQLNNMMFYRTDLLEQLGVEPPDTWEDVLAILPTLQENGMTFMYPKLSTQQETVNVTTTKPDFILPFYQHGAEFFTPDGLQPQLTNPEGLAAFKHWTDWFSKYNLPKEVPVFFNHFRSGDMPVGIDDITMYAQLMVAAPELHGHWKMLPLPGRKQPDGTIERWSMATTTSAMMMKNSERKNEAWTFLEWWTSDETQIRYATDIESFAGIAYRWNTANTNALQQLLWPQEDLNMLNEQDRWAKNMPYVPGYYFLQRELDFAWNNTVLEGKPAREALEQSEMSLQREMMRKQDEFGISPNDDLQIKPYDQPYRRE